MKELKQLLLPIAPIWNWNFDANHVTFIPYATNRTNLELKHEDWVEIYNEMLATNRTNLELKRDQNKRDTGLRNLPIAPIWNWNIVSSNTRTSPSPATNRTNLELKLEMRRWSMSGRHSTNRTNLELKLLLSNACHIWWKPTNRTNLELKRVMVIVFDLELIYQSHQSGIETRGRKPASTVDALPIAPIWNWNGRHRRPRHHGAGLPIAPIWNWNRVRLLVPIRPCDLPIAPIWNWNARPRRECLRGCCLPIAPIWNWNTGIVRETVNVEYATNRTNLELKLRILKTVLKQYGLPIAPIWNWNHLICDVRVADCTTNRTNLELKRRCPPLPPAPCWSTNRTNLELKQSSRAVTWQESGYYQSHQSGIETFLHHRLRPRRDILPIAPIWNWNPSRWRPWPPGTTLPIAPIWNWN